MTSRTTVPLRVGDRMPDGGSVRITRTDMVRYAGAGGDFNPNHHDEEFARAAGQPSVFSMGLLQGGMAAQRLAQWVGLSNVKEFAIRFTSQVWPDDELAFSGRVEQISEVDGRQVASVTVTATRQTGHDAVRARALVLIR